ncbi:MAG: response regulator [Acidobacteriota bacterium]
MAPNLSELGGNRGQSRSKPLILLVDDDPDSRHVMHVQLAKKGYRVAEADNGKSALELIEGQLPSLVVTDVQMAVMNGIELVETIRATERLSSLPVIIMSAHGTRLCEQALRAGANDAVRKPVLVDSLMQKIEALLKEELFGPSGGSPH